MNNPMNNQIFTHLMVLFFAAGSLVMLQGTANRRLTTQPPLGYTSDQTAPVDAMAQTTAYRGSGRISPDASL
jgi:hypothetical protein